jgi:undecaprenyl-diphosphatase
LPISSDGHLTVAAALMAPSGGGLRNFDVSDLIIVLHGGTLLSILVYYWGRICEVLRSDRRTIGLLVVATLPAVLVGVPVEIFFKHWLTNPVLAGIFLIVTGFILLCAARVSQGTRDYSQIGYGEAILIGLSQAAAILPGLSRSGCTIGTGLRLRLHPRAAATISFLMAIPVIFGACLYEFVKLLTVTELQTPMPHLAAGVFVSFVVGLISLAWLVRWLERGRFAFFAWWCIPLGTAVLVWQITLSDAGHPGPSNARSSSQQKQVDHESNDTARSTRQTRSS